MGSAQHGPLGLGAEGQESFESYVTRHDADRLSLVSLSMVSLCGSARILLQDKNFIVRSAFDLISYERFSQQ